MSFTLDYATNRGKVRLLTSDIDSNNPIFQDDAIDAFLSIALNGDVRRAAAQALLVMATNEVLVQKRIKLLDLSTDGPAEAEALRKLALDLREQADAEEIDGAFDWAEMVVDDFTFRERVIKEQLRGS